MRKLIMKMSMSLDGFVSGPNGEKDWVFKTGDEESLAWSVSQVREAGLIIMGRKSFEGIAPYWPTATGPFAAPMNEIPKAVFTKKGYKGFDPGADASPAAASWAKARVFDGDLANLHRSCNTALPKVGGCKGFPERRHGKNLQHIRLIFR